MLSLYIVVIVTFSIVYAFGLAAIACDAHDVALTTNARARSYKTACIQAALYTVAIVCCAGASLIVVTL